MAVMRVLLVEKPKGKNGNTHALAARMSELPRVRLLYIVGQDEGAREVGLHIYGDVGDIDKLIRVAHQEKIQLVVIEPENPVAYDILDACGSNGLTAFVGLCNAMPLLDPQKDLSS